MREIVSKHVSDIKKIEREFWLRIIVQSIIAFENEKTLLFPSKVVLEEKLFKPYKAINMHTFAAIPINNKKVLKQYCYIMLIAKADTVPTYSCCHMD